LRGAIGWCGAHFGHSGQIHFLLVRGRATGIAARERSEASAGEVQRSRGQGSARGVERAKPCAIRAGDRFAAPLQRLFGLAAGPYGGAAITLSHSLIWPRVIRSATPLLLPSFCTSQSTDTRLRAREICAARLSGAPHKLWESASGRIDSADSQNRLNVMDVRSQLSSLAKKIPLLGALAFAKRIGWQMAVCSVLILFAVALWKIPEHEIAPLTRVHGVSQLTLFEEEDKARVTLAQILGGAILLAGLVFTWKRIDVSRQGQLTERFIRAVEQLAGDSVSVRVGAIYALARVANESDRDRTAVIDLLAAFVREHAPGGSKRERAFVRPDVQSAMTVLGQTINFSDLDSSRRVDLSNTDLPGAKLKGANLFCVDLSGANLRGAQMEDACLRDARLWSACLDLANLSGADLSVAELEEASAEDTDFSDANLSGAVMIRANLKGADFSGANLNLAVLHDAHLEGADLEHISGKPLPFAILYNDERTRLPESASDWLISLIGHPGERVALEGEKDHCEEP
jgi:hypothetical protein